MGLEIKHEILVGELSSSPRAMLPIAAAFGGAVMPAAIYVAINAGTGGTSGWGIPMATDIAFALGILAAFLIAGFVGWTILRGAGVPRADE